MFLNKILFLTIILLGNFVFSQNKMNSEGENYHFLQYQIIYEKGTVKQVNLISHKKVKTFVKKKKIPLKDLSGQLVFKVIDDGSKGTSIVDYESISRNVEYFSPNGKIERITIPNDTIYKLIRIKADKHQLSLLSSIYDPNRKGPSIVFSSTPL